MQLNEVCGSPNQSNCWIIPKQPDNCEPVPYFYGVSIPDWECWIGFHGCCGDTFGYSNGRTLREWTGSMGSMFRFEFLSSPYEPEQQVFEIWETRDGWVSDQHQEPVSLSEAKDREDFEAEKLGFELMNPFEFYGSSPYGY